MKRCLLVAVVLSTQLVCLPVQAGEKEEREAVLEVLSRFFDAMTRRDPGVWRKIMLPDGMTYSQRHQPDGSKELARRTNLFLIENLSQGTGLLQERIWEPVVMVHRSIAVVWAPYDFHIDGKFSHCGVDVFELLKVSGKWKLGNALWTVERDRCEPSPLGPIQ